MTRFSVPNMSCGHCKATIENALTEADGGVEVSFNMEAREIDVDSTLNTAEIIETIRQAGYEASEIA